MVARQIRTYSYRPPKMVEGAVPGLNLVLQRMLSTDQTSRYRDAGEAVEVMELVAREPDGDLCLTMLKGLVVPALRALFLQHWEAKEGSQWKDNSEYGRLYVAREVACNREAMKWLVREQLEEGDSRSWDATVLCTILLRSQVHPLEAAEAPEDYADVTRFLEWLNDQAHSVALGTDTALLSVAVIWHFIERHLPVKSDA